MSESGRRVQNPVEGQGAHASWDENSKTYDHPAFGQIGASRVTGQAVLYGSDFVHQHYVTITIRRSQLNRDLSRDWHFGREELVEVALSEAQWATFVSSMNTGSGVPCTIEYVRGEGRMPGIPYRNENDAAEEDFAVKARAVAERVRAAIREAEEGIGQSLSKAKRDALLGTLRKVERDLSDSMPFMAKMFAEHMENTVESAKVEVEAHINARVQAAGLNALTGGGGDLLRLATGEGTESD